MTRPLTNAELLQARGWREVEPGMWCTTDLVGNSAMRTTMPTAKALEAVYRCDEHDVRNYGSVTYRPTAEQAELPLCAALAAKGGTEREVIEALFREVERLRADMMKLAHAKASPLKVFIP